MPRPGPAVQKESTFAADLESCVARHREELQEVFKRHLTQSAAGSGLSRSDDAGKEIGAETVKGAEALPLAAVPVAGEFPCAFSGATSLPSGPPQLSRWELSDFAREDYLRKSSKDSAPLRTKQTRADLRVLPSQEEQSCQLTAWCMNVILDPKFDMALCLIIFLNGIYLGLRVVYLTDSGGRNSEYFEIGNIAFFVCFFIELCMRIVAFGTEFFTVAEWTWNVFDLVTVLVSIFEMTIVRFTQVSDRAGSILVLARGIRIVRLVRVLRVIKFLRRLKTICITLLHTLSSLIASMFVLAVISYVFAICLTEAALERLHSDADSPESLRLYWGSLQTSIYTLFQSICGGVNWGVPADALAPLGAIYFWVFMLYYCLCHFAVLNVITGFFCEHAIDMAQADKDQLVQEQLHNKEVYVELFRKIFNVMDTDGSGGISLGELEAFLFDERLQAYFFHLNINVLHAWTVFRLLDADQDGSVSLDEFVTGLLRIRGPAKCVDIRSVHHDIKRSHKVLGEFMGFVEQRLQEIECRLIDKFSS